MPPEPDNRIEVLLKAYAKKRREEAGAPLELHPATRRMLQAEVARLRTGQERSWRFWQWPLFWPRLAFAMTMLVAVGGLAWLAVRSFNREPEIGPLAKRNPADHKTPALDSKSTVAPPADNLPVREKMKGTEKELTLADARELNRSANKESNLAAPANNVAENVKIAAALEATAKSVNAPAVASAPAPARERSEAGQLRASHPAPAAAPTPLAEPATKLVVTPTSLPDDASLRGDTSNIMQARSLSLGVAKRTDDNGAVLRKPADLGGLEKASQPSAVPGERKEELAEASPAMAGRTRSREVALAQQANSPASAATLGGGPQSYAFSTRLATGIAGGAVAGSRSKDADVPVAGKYLANGLSPEAMRYEMQNTRDLVTVEQTRAAPTAPKAPTMLTSFDFEQAGDRVRFLDADGSVYEGQLAAATDEERDLNRDNTETTKKSADKAEPAIKLQAEEKIRLALAVREDKLVLFRASGTNRSLNQFVLITGSLIPESKALEMDRISTNLVNIRAADTSVAPPVVTAVPMLVRSVGRPAAPEMPSTAPARPAASTPPSTPTVLLPARIRGTAVINGTTQVTVDAVRLPR